MFQRNDCKKRSFYTVGDTRKNGKLNYISIIMKEYKIINRLEKK